MSNNITINISTFEPAGSIGKLLAPNTRYKFESILGTLDALLNGMYYLNSSVFKLNWLDKKLSTAEFATIRQGSKRNIPNYWEIVKMLVADRLLQDRTLLNKLVVELSENVDDVVFVPIIKIKKGIINTIVKNDKLYIYGIITTRLIQDIVKTLRSMDVVDVNTMDDEVFSKFVSDTKLKVWDDVLQRANGNVAKVINDELTNNELLKAFLTTGGYIDAKQVKEIMTGMK